jgi:hypothetical protein
VLVVLDQPQIVA